MIATGSYVGNGSTQFIETAFCPDFIAVKGGSNGALMRFPDNWLRRSTPMAAAVSITDGIVRRPGHAGFWVGSAANVNTLGTTYYWLALANSSPSPMADASWMGNGLAGHVVPLNDETVTPGAAIIKRDSALSAVWTSIAGTSLLMSDGSALANGVSAFGAGTVTVGTATAVNELTPPAVGEGIEGIFFAGGSAIVIGSYTGDGASTRTIPLAITPKAMIIQPAALAARVVTDAMAGLTGPSGATAMASSEVTLGTLGFSLTSATLNGNGVAHYYVAFADHQATPAAIPEVVTSGRKAVQLYSREIASYIDCGTDNSLKFAADNLPHSIEWFGSLEWLDTPRTATGALIIRGGTNVAIGDAPNFAQCGIICIAPDDAALNWAGPQIGVIVADRYMLNSGVEVQKMWRTGIIIPHGEFVHWCVTGDGNGKWRLYRNGVLCKSREIDMRNTSFALANSKALTSRALTIGAADSAGTKVGSQRQTFLSARMYSVELTRAQVRARFQREALGLTSVADVTTGLIEEWSATNAHGGVLPATVAAANNGTVTGGAVVTLI